MDIKEFTEGYFQKTSEEQSEIVHAVLKFYLLDMIEQDGNLLILRTHLMLMKERSLMSQHYEVTEVLQQCIDGITETLNELSGLIPEDEEDENGL